MEVHQYSILGTVAVDARTVAETHTPQVEKEETETMIVSPGEVEIQVAGEDMLFGGAESTYSVGVGVVGWRSKTAS